MSYQFFQRPALVFSLAALTILTCLEVPIFVSCFCVLIWAWKWLADLKVVKTLSRRMTTFLSIAFVGYIFFQYRTLFVQEASSALLVGLAALKVMDYENRRDHLLLIILGFLLLTLKPLYGLDLYWLPVQIVCMISLWWALSQDPRKLPRPVLGAIFATALPIALVLFLVFPRVVLPWALSQAKGGSSSHMGFSTDLQPGRVAELAASNDLVFRARFPPSAEIDAKELYWRGGVLTLSKGMAWQADTLRPRVDRKDLQSNEAAIPYEIVLEPGNNAIFVLDHTYALRSTEAKIIEYQHSIWRNASPVPKAQRFYGKTSYAYVDRNAPVPADLKIQNLPPESEKWVAEVKAKHADVQGRRLALRELFTNHDFVYTLTPGIYKDNAMDEFLFHRRRGFCEHFAGAYATLARALGIPARVISGYQGAEYNPLGQFWRVTQKQAHAWVEIWTGEEWMRQDPTTWVQHIEFTRFSEKSIFVWIDEASDMYETMNFKWTAFLLDFDRNAQKLALREWLPKIFLSAVLTLLLFFLARLIRSWFFTSENRSLQIRQHQLSQLVQQIKEAEEEYSNQDLSHVPPLEILKSAQKHSQASKDFYQQVMSLYDRAFYRCDLDEHGLTDLLTPLQKKWVDMQVLQK